MELKKRILYEPFTSLIEQDKAESLIKLEIEKEINERKEEEMKTLNMIKKMGAKLEQEIIEFLI